MPLISSYLTKLDYLLSISYTLPNIQYSENKRKYNKHIYSLTNN